MSEKSLDNVLVKFDTKTTSEWAESAKIIAKSALALEDMGNGAFKAKIGDGEHTFAELPYFVSEGITQEQLNQTLQGYATNASVQQGLSGKVDAVEGKGLSSNDYTDEDKANVDNIDNLESEIADLKGFIGYTDSDIYGLEADFENNVFTRLAGAVGKTAGADFDSISAFGGRRRCNLSDNGEVLAYYGETGYVEDGSNGQVMVEQPKFYYKIVPLKLEKGVEGYILRKARYYVSCVPKAGFKLHTAFIKDNIEMDKVYFSAFESCIFDLSASEYLLNDEQIADFDADKLSSVANAKPVSGETQNLTRSNARKLAHNRGNGWEQGVIQSISAAQLLFLVEYGMFNSQTAIGSGIVNKANAIGNSAEKTGATYSLGSASGSVTNINGYNFISYRGEENIWGNISNWVDGINEKCPTPFVNGQVGMLYVADHNFMDDTATDSYEDTGIYPCYSAGSYISAFAYSEKFDWIFIPSECSGNSALPIGDDFYNQYSGWRVSAVSGNWNYGRCAGIFSCDYSSNHNFHGRGVGARLTYFPASNSIAQEVAE